MMHGHDIMIRVLGYEDLDEGMTGAEYLWLKQAIHREERLKRPGQVLYCVYTAARVDAQGFTSEKHRLAVKRGAVYTRHLNRLIMPVFTAKKASMVDYDYPCRAAVQRYFRSDAKEREVQLCLL